ncbi:MAG TPA: DinB family protein [Pyrinomonadaceae bacterium]|nr:DinB family protein [Pyrinomonadaceae bacterium]
MYLNEPLITELQIEAGTTRRMLERVPQDSLAWKPHEKSRTLGEIAAHIANLPGLFIATLNGEEFDRYEYQSVTDTVADILGTFDRNISRSLEVLKTLSDERMLTPWRYKYGEQVIFEMPRLVVIRTTALNHLIHHRGQLSVYLRLLDVPLPPVYGPTADEPSS